jgi:Transport and Golgi organisation 2
MCTALLSIEPRLPVLLVGVRDELMNRAWEPPGPHWPDLPDLIGGRDLQAGGTWLAVSPRQQRASCVLNACGQLAPPASRVTRGVLPLQAVADLPIDKDGLVNTDPFHLITAEPDQALWQSWDGHVLTERKLGPGLHFAVNSGLAADLLRPQTQPTEDDNGRAHELARIAHFLPKLQAATRPNPLLTASRQLGGQPRQAGQSVAAAWDEWFPLLNGDGLSTDDDRALIVRRDLGGGRIWGTTSISLVALSPAGLRYDFTGRPDDPGAWYTVVQD